MVNPLSGDTIICEHCNKLADASDKTWLYGMVLHIDGTFCEQCVGKAINAEAVAIGEILQEYLSKTKREE
jgi:hypothetical protein